MKRDQIHYTAVGTFVLACLIGLMFLLLRVTGTGTTLVKYYVHYPSVHGIITGTPVFFHGYKVGQVESVTPVQKAGNGGFITTLNVSSAQAVPDDSVAHVFESGLLGTVSIDIRGGASTTHLSPGSRIKGATRSDLLGAINAAADEYRHLSEQQIRPLVEKLNNRVDSLADTLEDGARSLVDELHQLTSSLNRSATQIESVLTNDNLTGISRSIGNIETFSAEAAALGVEMRRSNRELAKVLGHADKVLLHTDQLISENRPNINAALGDLRNTLRVVAEKIGSITHHLDGSSRNLHEFSRQIRQNPGLLLGSTPPSSRR